jgi:hypothetical protein
VGQFYILRENKRKNDFIGDTGHCQKGSSMNMGIFIQQKFIPIMIFQNQRNTFTQGRNVMDEGDSKKAKTRDSPCWEVLMNRYQFLSNRFPP